MHSRGDLAWVRKLQQALVQSMDGFPTATRRLHRLNVLQRAVRWILYSQLLCTRIAASWAPNVHVWGKLLEGHSDAEAYITAVQAMSTMLQEAMHDCHVHRLHAAAKLYHLTMLTHFSLLNGILWFLEPCNEVWKHQVLGHSNGGGRRAKKLKREAHDKQSEAGHHGQLAERAEKT
jgi:hypothetical protein